MSIHVVTVFGGTGFLGRRVVRHLRKHEFSVRIASRHPDRSRKLFGSDDPCLQSVEVDILDERMVADVLAGAYAAVNAVSLYVERGQETFHSVHVEAAERVAVQAHRVGVERLAHVTDQLTRALGEAVIRIWSNLPQEVQDHLFKEAVASQGEAIESQLAVFLHDKHTRTSDPPGDPREMKEPDSLGG